MPSQYSNRLLDLDKESAEAQGHAEEEEQEKVCKTLLAKGELHVAFRDIQTVISNTEITTGCFVLMHPNSISCKTGAQCA